MMDIYSFWYHIYKVKKKTKLYKYPGIKTNAEDVFSFSSRESSGPPGAVA